MRQRDPALSVYWRDVIVIALLTGAVTLLCIQFNVSELLRRWTAPWEGLQLDEFPAILLVLALGLVWFAVRRYRETQSELRLRQITEAQLAEALAANRKLSQEYVRLQEAGSKELARELHDEMGQYLNVVKLDAVSLRDGQIIERKAIVERAAAIVENCNHIHVAVTGLIRRLRPVGLDELGLAAAMEHCVNSWRSRLPSVELRLTVIGSIADLSESRALTVYRLVQEALTNVAKHSNADNVNVRIERVGPDGRGAGAVVVIITDDGVGARLDQPTQGLGLLGMRERVRSLDGSLELTCPPGGGFQLKARIPIEDTMQAVA